MKNRPLLAFLISLSSCALPDGVKERCVKFGAGVGVGIGQGSGYIEVCDRRSKAKKPKKISDGAAILETSSSGAAVVVNAQSIDGGTTD